MAARSADDVGVDCDEDQGIKPTAKLLRVERGTKLMTIVMKNCRKQRKPTGKNSPEDAKKHTRNNTCRTLEGINSLHTWECAHIQLKEPADRLAARQTIQHTGTTNMEP